MIIDERTKSITGIRRLNQDIRPEIEKLLDNAKEFILIGSYSFMLEYELYKRISKNDCVKVVIIPRCSFYQDKNKEENESIINDEEKIASLIDNNFAVVINHTNHAKFIVTENKTCFGSLNATHYAITYNNEGILLYDNLRKNKLLKGEDTLTKDIVKYTLENLLTYNHNEILKKNKSENHIPRLKEELQCVFGYLRYSIKTGNLKKEAHQLCIEINNILDVYKDKIDDYYYSCISHSSETVIEQIERTIKHTTDKKEQYLRLYINNAEKSLNVKNYTLSKFLKANKKIKNSEELIEKNKELVMRCMEVIRKHFKDYKDVEVNTCKSCEKVIDKGDKCYLCDPNSPYYRPKKILWTDRYSLMIRIVQRRVTSEYKTREDIDIKCYFVPRKYRFTVDDEFNLLTIKTKNCHIDIKYKKFKDCFQIYIEHGNDNVIYNMKDPGTTVCVTVEIDKATDFIIEKINKILGTC